MVNGHSFIPDIYIAPLQETYTEPLSVQLRPKRKVLRSLQKEDTLSRGSKRSVGGGLFQVGGANNRESSKLFKRIAEDRNQELTTSRRTKSSKGSYIRNRPTVTSQLRWGTTSCRSPDQC